MQDHSALIVLYFITLAPLSCIASAMECGNFVFSKAHQYNYTSYDSNGQLSFKLETQQVLNRIRKGRVLNFKNIYEICVDGPRIFENNNDRFLTLNMYEAIKAFALNYTHLGAGAYVSQFSRVYFYNFSYTIRFHNDMLVKIRSINANYQISNAQLIFSNEFKLLADKCTLSSEKSIWLQKKYAFYFPDGYYLNGHFHKASDVVRVSSTGTCYRLNFKGIKEKPDPVDLYENSILTHLPKPYANMIGIN